MINTGDTYDPVNEIGRVLKKIRQERSLTLDNAAEITGVSKTMLGQIERGVSVPTISVLWKIAKGLQVSLSTLLNEPEQNYKPVHITTEIPPIYNENRSMILYNTFPFSPVRGFEYFYIILKPDTIHHSEPHREMVEEYIVVTKGTLTLLLEDKTFYLEAPAKINFPCNIHHTYANETKEDVIFQNLMKC